MTAEPISPPDSGAAALVLRSTAAQWVAKAATIGLGLITVAFLTRHLGPQSYGRLAIIGSYVTVVVGLLDYGLPYVLTREISKEPTRTAAFVRSALWGRAALSVPGYAVAVGLAALLYPDDRTVVVGVAVALVGLVPGAIASTLTSVFQVQMRLGVLAGVELLVRTLNLSLTIAVVLSGHGVVAIVVVGVVTGLTQLGWMAFVLRRTPALFGRWDLAVLGRLLAMAVPVGIAVALNTLYVRIDALLISVLRPVSEVGLYSVAYRAMEMVLVFPSLFASAALPVLSRYAHDHNRFAAVTRSGLRFISLVVLPAATGVAVFAGPIAAVLGGPEFRGSAGPLRLLAPAVVASGFNILLGLAIIATDQQRRALWLNVTGLALNLLLNLVLIPSYGARGAALATSASETYVLVGAVAVLAGRLGPLPRAATFGGPALASAIAAGAATLLRGTPVVAAAVFVLTYLGAALLLRAVTADDIRLLRRALRRR